MVDMLSRLLEIIYCIVKCTVIYTRKKSPKKVQKSPKKYPYQNKIVSNPSFISCFDFVIGQQLINHRIINDDIAIVVLA